MFSDIPASAVCAANSSNSGRGIEERKLIYAGEYNWRERSSVIALRFFVVGSTRYSTGTSGIGFRWDAMCLGSCQPCAPHLSFHHATARTYICIVTPHVLKSLTRSTLLITSLPRSSKTKTFHIGFPSSSKIGADDDTTPLLCEAPSWF